MSQQRLHEAGGAIWGRSRDHQQSSTVADLFAEAGLEHDPDLLTAYYDFWEPHTLTDPEVRPMWEALRADGVKVGVLSNTIWPRAFHERIFERDGVLDLVDGDVYTSEIPWTKPSPHAFEAADGGGRRQRPGAVRVRRGPALRRHLGRAATPACAPSTCRTATIPPEQVGHSEGTPDAVVHSLAEIPDVVRAW